MTDEDRSDKIKGSDKTKEDFEKLIFDIKYDKEQFKDPTDLAIEIYRLAEERKKTNYVFSEILKRLDAIEESLATGKAYSPPKLETTAAEEGASKELLSDVDQKLLDYVQQRGKVDAEEIRGTFDYRGKNAASARLNSLFQRGLLTKARAGKKVLYWVRG